MRKLLEKMREEDEDIDVEVYPGVNHYSYRVQPIDWEEVLPEPKRSVPFFLRPQNPQ